MYLLANEMLISSICKVIARDIAVTWHPLDDSKGEDSGDALTDGIST